MFRHYASCICDVSHRCLPGKSTRIRSSITVTNKQTYASVTEKVCQCGHIEQLAKDQTTPVKFKAELNEYHIEYATPKNATASIVIYHCIFCGGAMPASKRGELFKDVPDDEKRRLGKLVSQLKTVDDALRVLGSPDSDDPVPEELRSGISAGDAPTRSLIYGRLSPLADVHVTVTSKNSIQVLVLPKRR
jgi:hypothetical protein